ncbi:hypothetical protein BH09ACT9_BH09ACT9_00100 [soil metagenome]
MMLEVIPDLEVIMHLDFEAEKKCETFKRSTGVVCGNPAAFISRARCCGKSVLVCTECKAKILNNTRPKMHVCGRLWASFEEALEFIPIGGD